MRIGYQSTKCALRIQLPVYAKRIDRLHATIRLMLRSPFARNLLLVLAAVFLLLRFVHLTADYPLNIRWDDGIATDEGWYASGAVNQQTWGMPLLQGDMNIPVIMPLWSVIAEIAFRIGGFSVLSLRVTAILFFFLCAALCCMLLKRYGAKEWIPLFLAMFALNPWAFAFSRAAFLEFPMLSLCLLAAVLVPQKTSQENATRLLRVLIAGLAFAAAMLLKTTAIALTPVLIYVIAEGNSFELRKSIRDVFLFFSALAVVYGTYSLTVIRPHAIDVQFYLSVVQNTLRFTPYGFIADTSRPFRYGLGSDHLLFSLSLLALIATACVRRMRPLWKDPLFAFAAVWLIAFLGFMVKHNNDPARYFAITIPACLFVAIALLHSPSWPGATAQRVLVFLIAVDMGVNGMQILSELARPRYSFHNAAKEIATAVQSGGGNAAVIGDDVYEVALHNGVRPLNLLFHSDSIAQQMERHHPEWWLQFAPIDDGRCFREVLSRAYSAEQRGEWQIFYPGQKLILWKIIPLANAVVPTVLTRAQEAACKPPVYN